MSSCTECHGMAGEKYDDHDSFHCPRLQDASQPTNSPDELNPCYVALWETIDDAATARRIEKKFKAAILASYIPKQSVEILLDELYDQSERRSKISSRPKWSKDHETTGEYYSRSQGFKSALLTVKQKLNLHVNQQRNES